MAKEGVLSQSHIRSLLVTLYRTPQHRCNSFAEWFRLIRDLLWYSI